MLVVQSKPRGVVDRVTAPMIAAAPGLLRQKRQNRKPWVVAGLVVAGAALAGAAVARALRSSDDD
jgi:NaMN:DMB phosphoribosyltransferase